MIPMPAPVVQAYQLTGALDVACPRCGADVGRFCTKPTGQLQRTPCVLRCRISDPNPGSSDPDTDSDAAQTRTTPVLAIGEQDQAHHPGEPRHPRDT